MPQEHRHLCNGEASVSSSFTARFVFFLSTSPMLPMDGTTQTSPALLDHVSPRHAAEGNHITQADPFLRAGGS